MRKHRTVRFVAALLFLCAFVFLVIGIIAAVMVGRGGLGAGWGTGWRGWLWIPLAAGACVNAVLFLVVGAVLQFLVKIDNNLRLSRARQAELMAAPVVSPSEGAAEPAPRVEQPGAVAPPEVTPVVEVPAQEQPKPELVIAPEIAPTVIQEAEAAEGVAEAESLVEEFPAAVVPVGLTMGAIGERVVEAAEAAEEAAVVQEPAELGVAEPELSEADLNVLVMTPEMVSPGLEVAAPEPVIIQVPEQPAEAEAVAPTEELPQEIESTIADELEAPVSFDEAVPAEPTPPQAPQAPGEHEVERAAIESFSDAHSVADEEIVVETTQEPTSGFQIQPEVEIGEPEPQAPEEEPAPTPFPKAEEGEPGAFAEAGQAATPEEAAWPVVSADDLTGLPWETGVGSSTQAGLAATETELPNEGPVHIEGGRATGRLPGSEEAARIAAEMHAQRELAEGGYGTIPPGDDFTRIHGVGPVFARRLREAGVTTYAALAEASDELLIRITDGNLDRVARDDWRGQARKLLG